MAFININVEALICEDPVFTSVDYTGSRYEFSMNWTSNGEYLSTIDNTTIMNLAVELYHPSDLTNPYNVFSPTVPPPIPFNGTNYLLNIFDYDSSFSSKDQIIFRLGLTGQNTCSTSTSYTIPTDTLP